MGWETRRNGRYYYSKRKQGGKVSSEYRGSGYPALLAEQLTESVRAEAKQKRREWAAIKDEQERIEAIASDFEQLADSFADAAMLLTGYHQHKRQWRKKRERDSKITG